MVVVTSEFRRTWAFTEPSIWVMSAGDTARPWLKSKRSRSGATNEPFWVTCSPRRRLSAACRRWVAVWLARSSARRGESMASATLSPTPIVPSATAPAWT